MNLTDLNNQLRASGVNGSVQMTGGDVHSIVIPLSDGSEIIVTDIEGFIGSPDQDMDGSAIIWYSSDGADELYEDHGIDSDLIAQTIIDTVKDAGLEMAS